MSISDRMASLSARRAGVLLTLAGLSLLAFGVSPAWAQDSGEQPSLDELLEIDKTESSPATQPTSGGGEASDGPEGDDASGASRDTSKETSEGNGKQRGLDPELEQLLEGKQTNDPFASAVADMETVAQRLGRELDAGRDTQRMQQQILKKLDQVLAKARQRRQQGGGSKPRKPQGGQNPAGQRPDGQQQGQSQSQSASAGGSDPSGTSGEGGSTDARQGESLEALRRQWGNLPPRLRDELSEGLDESFSPVYQSLTEQYYRRLAEQAQEGSQP